MFRQFDDDTVSLRDFQLVELLGTGSKYRRDDGGGDAQVMVQSTRAYIKRQAHQ